MSEALKGWDENSWRENLNELNAAALEKNLERARKLFDDAADVWGRERAALEAEVGRLTKICGATHPLPNLAPFVALARAAQVLWTIYESLAGDPDPRFACWRNLRDALAHPALKKALGP